VETIDIKSRVRAFIADNFILGEGSKDLGDSDSFMQRHVIDSTGFLELVTFLEETYGFSVADEEMIPDNLDSLDNLDAYVRRKLGR
jgi:acyl carrier protein